MSSILILPEVLNNIIQEHIPDIIAVVGNKKYHINSCELNEYNNFMSINNVTKGQSSDIVQKFMLI